MKMKEGITLKDNIKKKISPPFQSCIEAL